MITKWLSHCLKDRFLLLSLLLHALVLGVIAIKWKTPFSSHLASNRPIIYTTLVNPARSKSAPIVHPAVTSLPSRIKAIAPRKPVKKIHSIVVKKDRRKPLKKTPPIHQAHHAKITHSPTKQPKPAPKKVNTLTQASPKKVVLKKPSQPIAHSTPQRQKQQQAQANARAQIEQQMQAQIAEEQRAFLTARRTQLNREIDRYKRQLVAAIGHRWLVPKGADPASVCQLLIHTALTGDVLNVTLVKSSGNLALDRSVLAAVRKASPLPMPSDPALFNQFSELYLTVKPEDIIR